MRHVVLEIHLQADRQWHRPSHSYRQHVYTIWWRQTVELELIEITAVHLGQLVLRQLCMFTAHQLVLRQLCTFTAHQPVLRQLCMFTMQPPAQITSARGFYHLKRFCTRTFNFSSSMHLACCLKFCEISIIHWTTGTFSTQRLQFPTFPWRSRRFCISHEFPWLIKFADLCQFSLTCRNPRAQFTNHRKIIIRLP